MIQRNPNMEDKEVHRGLVGIVMNSTEITSVDGQNGVLLHRSYSIHELANHSTFEETAYLLLYGELPTQSELDGFSSALKANRNIPGKVVDLIHDFKDGHPMDVLRTAVSALSTFDTYGRNDNSLEVTLERGIRLISQMPTIVMHHQNIRQGLDPIQPNESLDHAANFLYMMNGNLPSRDTARLMDIDFIVHADHDVNASSTAARVAGGTKANLYEAVTAAIATLDGPAHGGAAEDVMKMVMEIGEPENAVAYIQSVLDGKRRVTGFGHRVYKFEDPRARHLERSVQKLSQEVEDQMLYEVLKAVQEKMEPLKERGIYPNVDFFAGVAYYLMGFSPDMFVPIFAVGRIPGWTVQFIEQIKDDILIRPLSRYEGPSERPYVPISQR